MRENPLRQSSGINHKAFALKGDLLVFNRLAHRKSEGIKLERYEDKRCGYKHSKIVILQMEISIFLLAICRNSIKWMVY